MDQILALRTFVRIAEAGSLSKAAGSLALPKSTVSKLLQDLEHHLGTKLLNRTTRALAVTPEGAEYYDRAVRLLAELTEMDATASGSGANPTGRLRVDIGSSLANLVLIPALPRFRSRYPNIELVLGVSDRPVDLIGEGIDCAIRGGALSDSSLKARKLGELDYVTCAAPSYIEAHGTPLEPSELLTKHIALTYFSASDGTPFSFRFERGDDRREVRPRAKLSVNESTAHMTALLEGLGIAQTFEFVARPYLADGRLVELLPAWKQPPHPLHIIYPANRHPNAKLRAFADWSAEVFAKIDRRRS